jgi:diaminohydroxyphosphoribosylaminopyrimidine deaminase/5-amino-6-(5-phosphoribosylamino)uracil reductase
VRVLPVPDAGRVPSIRNALALLAGEGVTRLLVEGGEIVWRAFAAEWLVDEVALFLAGGEGKGSPSAAVLAGEYVPGLDLSPTAQRRVGGDTLSMFRVVDLPRPDVGRSA